MIEYEVGARPSGSVTLVVRDELDNPVNVVGYETFRLEMRDTDDKPVDLNGTRLIEVPGAIGVFSVTWPNTRTLFKKKGKYVLRLVLENLNGTVDITRTAEIWVRDFGKVK